MKIRALQKEDTNIIKGIGILCIIIHNLLHWGQPLNGKENEFYFASDNVLCFFNAFAEHPAESLNIIFSYLGHFGVQLFIFISGLGLAMSMIANPRKYGSFIFDRLKKLYPLVIIAFIFYIMFTAIAFYRIINIDELKGFAYKFLFIHTLIPGEGLTLNGPLWFLGLILQLYLLFPLLFKLIGKYKTKAFVCICLISYAIVYACIYTKILPENLSVMQNFPGHLPEFALGILFAYSKDKKVNWIWFVIALAIFCLGNFYKVFYPFTFLCITYIFISIFLFIKKEGKFNFFDKFLVFFGSLSMTLFATHGCIRWPFVVIAGNYNNAGWTFVVVLIYIVSAIIIALGAKAMYQWMIDVFSKIKLSKKNNIVTILCVIALFFAGCNNNNNAITYPNSKVWAHRVNDIAAAKEKSKCFDGLEVDAYYSEYQNKIFVGHDIEDTANNVQLDKWFDAISNPSEKYFWIDFKNLDTKNADKAADIILGIMSSQNMNDNVFVESYNVNALKKIKGYGLRTILWTENLKWNNVDTAQWIDDTKKMIEELSPDAISNEEAMYELLVEYFPEQNIHLWQKTPTMHKAENANRTRDLCRDKSVKVVLVDYDEPIEY